MERGEHPGGGHPVVYCLVPGDLAARLHEPLRRHFADDLQVEVIVESRVTERRRPSDRRTGHSPRPCDRRLIRASDGRRVTDRRATAFAIDRPQLPRKARPFADRLVFIERVEPTEEAREDIDTDRMVRRIQAGEARLFSDLYMRYFDRVYTYLRIAFKDPHEAEDATQQVFVKVLNALPRYESRAQPFRAWLFTIVRNHALSQLKKLSRVEVVEPAALAAQEDNGDEGGLRGLDWISDAELLMFLERLPLEQRQVLLLRYLLDLTHEQAAEVLGQTAEQVRKTQNRALAFLRQRLVAIGRQPTRRDRDACLRPLTQVRVLRERRFALIG